MGTFAPEQYKETLIFLATAGVVVPLFRRLKFSPVLGFLGAGVLLGPYGLGALARQIGWLAPFALDNVEQIAPVAEFGVVFLLFMIGLELSWHRLAIIGRLVFGLGALQVFGSAAALGALALILGEPPTSAAVLGFALALSSTAIVIPVLAEAKRLGTTAGRTIFAVLLFQDLMVAPLLFMVAMLGMRGGGLGMAVVSFLVPALTGLSVIVLGGRLVMRPLFRHVAAAGSTEFFMAACLLVVIGTGVLTAASGLSMGLGAFIAGILLAETEYRREIEVTIEPFKGLLLGLFFVSIGASLDLSRMIFRSADGVRSCALHYLRQVLRQLARWVDSAPARAGLHRGRAYAGTRRGICFRHRHRGRRRQGHARRRRREGDDRGDSFDVRRAIPWRARQAPGKTARRIAARRPPGAGRGRSGARCDHRRLWPGWPAGRRHAACACHPLFGRRYRSRAW